jgi:RNA polymerase sigma-70 factor (ECF subfamily)
MDTVLSMRDASRDLIASAARGDVAARESLFGAHFATLRAYVRARLGPRLRARETSHDIAQSVCREALERLDRFEYRGRGSFRAWLQRHAELRLRNKARHWERDKRTSAREHGTEELERVAAVLSTSRAASTREELERVVTALRELPPDYREVILLARVDGLGHEEIAKRLGRTPLATRTLLSRALARLSTKLEEHGD